MKNNGEPLPYTVLAPFSFSTRTDVFFDRSTLTAGHFGTSGSSETLCTSFERSNQCVIGATKLKAQLIAFIMGHALLKKAILLLKRA